MSRLMRDGTAEPVSRGEILRRERGQGKFMFSFFFFPVQLTTEQDWQPYPVDPYPSYVMTICIRTYSTWSLWVSKTRRSSDGVAAS